MDENLKGLKEQLALQEWPNVYLFKFIIPNESHQIAQLSALFGDDSEIVMHPSRNSKFISFSVKELMLDVDSIVAVYEKASSINGIISL